MRCWRGRRTMTHSRPRSPRSAMSKRGSTRAIALVDRAFALLKKNTIWDSETVEAEAKRLLSQHESLTRELRRLAPGGRRHRHDPHPWRFPSRSGAGRERRHLHHRFRGRARAPARRATRQGKPAARRRRIAALVRLCGGRDARSEADHRCAGPRGAARGTSSDACATAPSARSSTPTGKAARPRRTPSCSTSS